MKTFLKRFGLVVLLAGMVVLFFYFAFSRETLEVYDTSSGESTYTVEAEPETKKEIESTTYYSDEIAMSLEIPAGWEYVLKDGYDTYVHAASASSIQIQVLSYYPMVNNASYESMAETYGGYGYTVTEFNYTANNAYYVIYQSYINSGVVDYLEWVVWDRQHVVKLLICFNDGYYDRLSDEIWTSIYSFTWDYEDPIEEDLFLVYQLYGDFEFAVPMNWYVEGTDSAYYAYDEATGANAVIQCLGDATPFSSITQVDFANYMSNGLSSFVLAQCEQGDDYYYGQGTFYSGDMQWAVLEKYFMNGAYDYVITWQYPVDAGEEYLELARNAIDFTRIFYESEDSEEYTLLEDESESESEKISNDVVFVPDEIPSQAIGSSGSEYSSGLSGDEEVSTFADALMTVAGITSMQATEVDYIWSSYIGTTPVYAEAYAQTDTSLVIYIQDDYGIDYFLFLSLETGDFQEIRAYSIDGETIVG